MPTVRVGLHINTKGRIKMEYAILIITLAVIVLFWGLLKRSVFVLEDMSIRGLNNLNREQKVQSAKNWSKKSISPEELTQAKTNIKAIDELII